MREALADHLQGFDTPTRGPRLAWSSLGSPDSRGKRVVEIPGAALPSLSRLAPADVHARAAELFDRGYRQRAVHELCTPGSVRVAAEAGAATAGLPPRRVRQAATVLQVCGFVVLQGAMPENLIRALKEDNEEQFWAFYNSSIAPDASLRSAASHESDSFAIRSRGRFEYKLHRAGAFAAPELLENHAVLPVLAAGMRSLDFQLDTFSCVTSLPGSPPQHWHSDAGTLFQTHSTNGLPSRLRAARLAAAQRLGVLNTPADHARANTHPTFGYFDASPHLPPHGIVAFTPLINVTQAHGPTVFRAGTHLACPDDHLRDLEVDGVVLDTCPEHATHTLHATAQPGDVILFDFRVSHRGGANTHPHDIRPMLYQTFLMVRA